ncbi:putative membrane protein [Candidatus Protofrankia californiensis]|uniref:Putative membrane protein n=1 Tax=Candidatus Protofrankia californiensis TaxID=1839754 RepID=A0A1C3PFY9_9ACTN|nr:putative membrane protein [Candidatus Protofrankia californiensis]
MGIGSIFTLAFLVILLPGVAGYALLRLAGLAIGPSGLLGLLLMFVCLGLYPSLLQRLGWVPRRARRPR